MSVCRSKHIGMRRSRQTFAACAVGRIDGYEYSFERWDFVECKKSAAGLRRAGLSHREELSGKFPSTVTATLIGSQHEKCHEKPFFSVAALALSNLDSIVHQSDENFICIFLFSCSRGAPKESRESIGLCWISRLEFVTKRFWEDEKESKWHWKRVSDRWRIGPRQRCQQHGISNRLRNRRKQV